jgi:hypothetical protein
VHRYTGADASDTDSPEVHLQAAQVRVPSVDHPSAGRRGDQHGLRTRIRPRQTDRRLSREVMKIARKRLELRDNSKDIGVRHWPSDLQRPARTIDLAELCVCLGQGLDRLTSWPQPSPKRERFRIPHASVWSILPPKNPASTRRQVQDPLLLGNSDRRRVRTLGSGVILAW